jgi:hypothetical protein
MAANQAPPANTNLTGGTAPAEPEALPLPPHWPGAFSAYKYSKQAIKLNLGTFVTWLLIEIVVSGGISLLGNSASDATKGLFQIISYLITPLFAAILTKILIAGVRRQSVDSGEAFSRGLPYWLNNVILSILVGVTLIVSFLLLIVPFFFVWPRLTLATYFLVDKNLGPVEAYKASWNATKGYAGRMYGILGAQIAMGLLVITIIGIPFAIYFLVMYSAAHAVIYEIIINSPARGAQASASTPAPIEA